MNITKAQLSESVHKQTGLTKSMSARLVNSIFDIMKGVLADGEEILISGFGKFCVSAREVKGQVLLEGEETARYLVKKIVFKCSPLFRERINRKNLKRRA